MRESFLANLLLWSSCYLGLYVYSVQAFTPSTVPFVTQQRIATTSQRKIRSVETSLASATTSRVNETDTSTGIRTEFFGPPTPGSSVEDVKKPKGSKHAWEVHKFGGASLATAELYKTVGDLLVQEAQGRGEGPIPTMAVVSAKGGMTDLLVQVVDSALTDMEKAKDAIECAFSSQVEVLKELVPDRPDVTGPIIERLNQDKEDIWSCIQSLRMLHTIPPVTMEVVTGYGEIWSAQTLHAYLQTLDVPTAWIDARDVLVVKSTSSGLGEKGSTSTGGVTPLWDTTAETVAKWWHDGNLKDQDFSQQAPIVVVTGFVARTPEGVPTTLKRSGSDYSATIFGKLLEAGRVTMWKNTNGVYTADPRCVPEAFPIASLKYDEAMELAYFGAQVLHPSAMEPCIERNTPVYVRNIFNPAFEGTVIQGRSATLKEANAKSSVKNWLAKSGDIPIKGITSVDKVAMVTLEGATLAGSNVASRVLGAMASNDITVLIITQASSESSITIAIPENQGDAALAALEDAFELELSRSTINSVSLAKNMSIVAIVGEGMALTSGVASTLMSSLARSNVNLRLIAQGSSERQIAVVVKRDDVSRALRAAHMAFTLSETTASVAVLGATGTDGRALIQQLAGQQETLVHDLGVNYAVNLASCRTKFVRADTSKGLGLDLPQIRLRLRSEEAGGGEEFDLDRITEAMKADVNPLRIIVDCTDSDEVGDHYEEWLSSGIHVISPGRSVGSGDLERYKRIAKARHGHAVEWFQGSGVGSALPILPTIQDLLETGDSIKTIKGSLSETMAFVMNNFNEEVPFSEALKIAVEKGYTEKDLCEDLSGIDTAKKVVIMARQIGLDVNLEDVEVESLLPEGCYLDTSDETLLEKLQNLDAPMLERFRAAAADDRRLRYIFMIDTETAKCKCWLDAVDTNDPTFRLRFDENLVALETGRYRESPLIIKGAAAGPELTAAGIFADLLRLARAYSANKSV